MISKEREKLRPKFIDAAIENEADMDESAFDQAVQQIVKTKTRGKSKKTPS